MRQRDAAAKKRLLGRSSLLKGSTTTETRQAAGRLALNSSLNSELSPVFHCCYNHSEVRIQNITQGRLPGTRARLPGKSCRVEKATGPIWGLVKRWSGKSLQSSPGVCGASSRGGFCVICALQGVGQSGADALSD